MSAYSDRITSLSPISYYRLGETLGAGTATDVMGANNGTYVNTPTQGVAGAIFADADTATSFAKASTEYVLCKTGNIVGGLTDMTIEAWIKTTDGGFPSWYCERHAAAGAAMVRVLCNSGRPHVTMADSGGGTTTLTTASPVPVVNDGAWHHVVFTVAGTAMTIYQDGKTVATGTQTSSDAMNASMDCRIGSDAQDAATFWDGTIDEVALYGTALATITVQQNYWLGSGTGQDVNPESFTAIPFF